MILDRKRYNEDYIPTKETIEFYIWFKTYIKETNNPAVAHFHIIDHIMRKAQHKVIEASRGLAKTSLVAVYFTLYCIFKGYKPNFGEFRYILIVSDTVGQVVDIFEHILTTLDENEALAKHIKLVRKRLDDDPLLVFESRGKKIYIKGKGSGQKLRGRKGGGHRPDIIIIDDLENEEIVDNPDTLAKLKKWFFGALLPSVNPNKYEIILIGTPLHQNALLVNLLYSKEWYGIQLPACEKFPCKPSEFISAWKDRFTYNFLNKMYNTFKDTGEEQTFYQEYMLEITPKEGLLYELNQIRWYKRRNLEEIAGKLTYYISIDLAVSEKRTADYTSIIVVGIANNHWFVVDGFFGRIPPDETIRQTFIFAKMYQPEAVVIEKVGFQASMKTFFEKEMLRKGFFFNIEMVSRTKSKLSVFKALQPIVKLGRLWLPEDYIKDFITELKNEMSNVTHTSILSKHDDVLDSLAQLTLIELLETKSLVDNNEYSIFDYSGYNKSPYIF